MRFTTPFLLGVLTAAGGPGHVGPEPVAAQDQPVIDPFAIVAAADRMAESELWPGFDPRQTPVAIFDGRNTLLFRHPAPPQSFQPMAGVAGAWRLTRRHPAVVANGTVELGGVRTATLIAPDTAVPVGGLAGVLIHEAFHVFQVERYPGWTANEVELFTYPVDDPELLALRRAEGEALRRALGGDDADLGCWARVAGDLRQGRLAGLPPGSATYEQKVELFEGLATYVERRATGAPDGSIMPADHFPADEVRRRAYRSGAAIARILDRMGATWREKLDQEPDTPLDALLGRVIAEHVGPTGACIFTDEEAEGFRSAASRDVERLLTDRAAELERYLERPGWRLLVVADGQPLGTQGFDPLNARVVADGAVLHTRFLRVSNEAGTVEVMGRAVLTESAGDHPLFPGLRALTITGLEAQPRVTTRRRVVTVTADGVTAEFRGATVDRSGTTVTLRLPET